MNIYEYAMKAEKDGERYYRELANKTDDVGLKSILMMLADEEVKHYVVFDKMNKTKSFQQHNRTSMFLQPQRRFLKKCAKKTLKPVLVKTKLSSISALRSEENSFKFYVEKALMVEDAEQKHHFYASLKKSVNIWCY